MRVLSEAEGFARLPDVEIGILRGHTKQTAVVEALARHIVESLDNLSVPAPAAATQPVFPMREWPWPAAAAAEMPGW